MVTSQLLALFCPFLADEIYVALTGEASVHLSDWPAVTAPTPTCRPRWQRHAGWWPSAKARTDAKVKVRQPLLRAFVLHTRASRSVATWWPRWRAS